MPEAWQFFGVVGELRRVWRLQKLGKDDKFIVGCGEGLRSLVALDMLCEAGYSQVVWLENGFSATPPGTLPTEGPSEAWAGGEGGGACTEHFDTPFGAASTRRP